MLLHFYTQFIVTRVTETIKLLTEFLINILCYTITD